MRDIVIIALVIGGIYWWQTNRTVPFFGEQRAMVQDGSDWTKPEIM